jgi:hypothetical protein
MPVRARAAALKSRFLTEHPHPGAKAVEFRARYRSLFSREGLRTVSPEELKYFANSNLAGNPGTMTVFNNAWNRMDRKEASARVRAEIEYLLSGPEETPIEDRLTDLIVGRNANPMPGFREALLTKVLCMVKPERFLPIHVYNGVAGKRQVAKLVFDLSLPAPESVSWTIGRLVFWSNDLLRDLVGDGFEDTEHVAEFLWWAKNQADPVPAS